MLREFLIPALEVDFEEGTSGATSKPEQLVWSVLGHETLLGVGGLLNIGTWWWGRTALVGMGQASCGCACPAESSSQ